MTVTLHLIQYHSIFTGAAIQLRMDSLIVGEDDKVRLVGFPQNGIIKWRNNAEQVLVQHSGGSSDSFLELTNNKFVDFGEMTHGTCSRDFDLCETGISSIASH